MEFRRDNKSIMIEADAKEYIKNQVYRNNINAQVDLIHNDINDYGPSMCCDYGRIKYHGGSRYFCDQCGEDWVVETEGFVSHSPE